MIYPLHELTTPQTKNRMGKPGSRVAECQCTNRPMPDLRSLIPAATRAIFEHFLLEFSPPPGLAVWVAVCLTDSFDCADCTYTFDSGLRISETRFEELHAEPQSISIKSAVNEVQCPKSCSSPSPFIETRSVGMSTSKGLCEVSPNPVLSICRQ